MAICRTKMKTSRDSFEYRKAMVLFFRLLSSVHPNSRFLLSLSSFAPSFVFHYGCSDIRAVSNYYQHYRYTLKAVAHTHTQIRDVDGAHRTAHTLSHLRTFITAYLMRVGHKLQGTNVRPWSMQIVEEWWNKIIMRWRKTRSERNARCNVFKH